MCELWEISRSRIKAMLPSDSRSMMEFRILHDVCVAESNSMTLMLARNRLFQVARWLMLCLVMDTWILPVISSDSVCLGQEKPSNANDETIGSMVLRLGSSEFAVRESAMEELSKFDEKKLNELELVLKGLPSDELETRIRLASIIARIKNDRTQKQTRSFLRSTDPDQTFGFDGWKSFVKISGSSRNAKMVFLKLIDLYPELVFSELGSKKEALEKARSIAGAIVEKRRADRAFSVTPGYDLADAIAMLYCLSTADDLTDPTMETISIGTFRMSPFSQFLLDPQFKKTTERMLANWANHIQERKLECMAFLVDKDFAQAKDIALRILESNELNPFEYIPAMQCLFRFGAASDVPRIERWLDDKNVLFVLPINPPGNVPGNSQVNQLRSAEFRDAALLVSMHLAGADYSREFPEFQSIPLWGFREESLLMPPNSDAAREERIKKWKLEHSSDKKK